MASTQQFIEFNGPAGGTPARSLTSLTGVTNCDYKSIDDPTTSYTLYPVSGNSNSFEKFQSVIFQGTFNTILNSRWNHISGVLDAGVSLFALVSGSGFYTTPSQNTNASLINLSSTGSASVTGLKVNLLSTGSWNNDYSNSSTGNPTYTPFLISQLRISNSAAPGTISSPIVYQLVWDEN